MLVEGNLQELHNWIFQTLFLKFQIELSHRSYCSNMMTQQADEEGFWHEAVGS